MTDLRPTFRQLIERSGVLSMHADEADVLGLVDALWRAVLGEPDPANVVPTISLPVHYVDYASQGDLKIACTQAWTGPKWGAVVAVAAEVYETVEGALYTFNRELATCGPCRAKLAGFNQGRSHV